jgi:hypothetical protein
VRVGSVEFDKKLGAQPATTKTTTKTTTTPSSSCCNCEALAQIQKSLNDLVALSCQSTKPSTSTTTASTTVKCLGHYWPIGNQTVKDTITGQQATSLGSPQFVADRNGLADGAILVNSTCQSWHLLSRRHDSYYVGFGQWDLLLNLLKKLSLF